MCGTAGSDVAASCFVLFFHEQPVSERLAHPPGELSAKLDYWGQLPWALCVLSS